MEGSCKWEAKLRPSYPASQGSPQGGERAGAPGGPPGGTGAHAGGSRVASAQGGTQEYAEPYQQGGGESTLGERDNQAPETQAELRVKSLANQKGDPEEEQVFGTPSNNEDDDGKWMEPPQPRRQQKRDRDRGYEPRIESSASAKLTAGATLGPKGTQGQGPSQTGREAPHPIKEEKGAQAPTHQGSALGAGAATAGQQEAGGPLGRAVPSGKIEPQ